MELFAPWGLSALFFSKEDKLQSTLVISKSKGPSKILRDIRTSTYQICRNEKKIHRATKFHKWKCYLTPEVWDTLKILWKRGEIAPLEQFLLFSTVFCYLLLEFHVENRDHIFTSRYAVIQGKRVRDNECWLYVTFLAFFSVSEGRQNCSEKVAAQEKKSIPLMFAGIRVIGRFSW